MQTVFIEFLTESDRIRGFYELIRRSRVQSVSGRIYHLPREALQILDDLHIGYRFVECVGPEQGSRSCPPW